MISIVYLAHYSPSVLSDDLMRAGIRVWDCLSISEVEFLCEQRSVDVVVIAAGFEPELTAEIKRCQVCIELKSEPKVADVLWELSLLFPGSTAMVQ